MKATAYLGLLAGLAIFTALIAYHGFAEVGSALAVAGWGLALIALFHAVPIMLNTLSWRALLKHANVHAPMVFMLWARWIAESINSLLPAAQVGGDWVKARLAMRHGMPAPIAGASVMVDLTGWQMVPASQAAQFYTERGALVREQPGFGSQPR